MLYAAAFRRLYLSNNWRWGIEPVGFASLKHLNEPLRVV